MGPGNRPQGEKMAASTSLGPWGSKVHFTGSDRFDIENGGIVAYPVLGSSSEALATGTTIPFNNGVVTLSMAQVTTARMFILPTPYAGSYLDIIRCTTGTTGSLEFDATSNVNILGTSGGAARYMIASSSNALSTITIVNLVGLSTATWAIVGASPGSSAVYVVGSSS
jgi:hypothetical protein